MKLVTLAVPALLALCVAPAFPDAGSSTSTSSSGSVSVSSNNGVTVITESSGDTTRVYTVGPNGQRTEVTDLEKYRVSTEGNTSVYQLPGGSRVEITTDENGRRVSVKASSGSASSGSSGSVTPQDPEARIRELEERVRRLEKEGQPGTRLIVPDPKTWTPGAPRVWKWDSPELKQFQLQPFGQFLDPKTRKELERSLQDAQRSLKDAMKQFQDLTPQQRKEIEKAMKDAMPEIRRSLDEAMRELQQSLKQLQEGDKALKEIGATLTRDETMSSLAALLTGVGQSVGRALEGAQPSVLAAIGSALAGMDESDLK